MKNIVSKISMSLGIIIICSTSFAANCSQLITLGSQKSVSSAIKGMNISRSDIRVCRSECPQISSNIINQEECTNSMAALFFAISYNNTLSELSPNTYANSISSPTPSFNSSQPQLNSAPLPSTKKTTTGSSYIITPSSSTIKSKNKNSNHISWY